MSRNSADAECIDCGKTFTWFFKEPRKCPSCSAGKVKNNQPKETIGLCGGGWSCEKCHLTFLWDNYRTQAAYQFGSGPVIRKQIGGKTKPEKCPECGHKKIDPIGG